MKRTLVDACVVLGALVILVFVAFNVIESGDIGVVVLGTSLYVPYAIVLALFIVLLQAGLRLMRRSRMEEIVLPLLPLIGWMILSKGSIEIRYWIMGYTEMLSVIGVLALANVINSFRNRMVEHA
ncbi:MAG TPA: hypothetical protein PKJ19_02150 [Flavobacteriales bacterium]|nr:hypothetical protein [Flavobacteriales bacterium]HNU56708.1 hypothetical protein [Flavobacteriales bacterium]